MTFFEKTSFSIVIKNVVKSNIFFLRLICITSSYHIWIMALKPLSTELGPLPQAMFWPTAENPTTSLLLSWPTSYVGHWSAHL